AVDPGGEVEIARAAGRAVVTRRQGPQPVGDDGLAVLVGDRALEVEAAALMLEGVDAPVAEVADEQIAAEAAERVRRDGQATGRVQRPARRDAADEAAVAIELVDEAVTGAGDVV